MSDQRLTQAEWEALRESKSDKVSGGPMRGAPRHTGPWKCPACLQENTRPLEQGCEHCGSGQPGRHVGVDPRVERALLERAPSPTAIREAIATDAPPHLPADLDQAFTAFIERYAVNGQQVETHVYVVAREAFLYGYQVALGRTMQPPTISGSGGALPLEGTKETRTIVAALDFFIENVLQNNPEEVLTGEWCSAADARALIAQLERRA